MRSFTLDVSCLLVPAQLQEQLPQSSFSRRKIFIISGPTAVGKSQLALEFAEKVHGEIITADSMQVYQWMNIGTAKPTIEEQLRVPHHLVDICEITQNINVVNYVHAAEQAINSVASRGKLPIFVGGTGFYLRALLYGPPAGPPPNHELRQELESQGEKYGYETLYARLQSLDHLYAEQISAHDHHKIVRALEVITLSGKPLSSFPWSTGLKAMKYDARCFFFNRPRESLYQRIDRRCDQMIRAGLIEETRFLRAMGLEKNISASHAIGYRQALTFLESDQSDLAHQEFVNTFHQATRKYAKRQITWFKRETAYHWLDLDRHDPETVIDIMLNTVQEQDWSF